MSGEGGQQTRSWSYDGRGLLMSETHPELGSNGNGSTSYGGYDARGHAWWTTSGSKQLAFTYDAAERLTRVDDRSTGLLLRELAYDDNCSTTVCLGRLALTRRTNNAVASELGLGAGAADVTETYGYDDGTGMVSQRDQTLWLTGEVFRAGQTTDLLGEVASVAYPCRLSGGACNPAERRRTVTNGYTNGFLSSVPGYASAVSYGHNGAIASIVHANGVSDTIDPDPSGIARPHAIGASNAAGPLWSTDAYSYDGSGNIKAIGTAAYGYDAFGRLTSSSVPRQGATLQNSFSYDRFGNLLATSAAYCRDGGPCFWSSGVPRTVVGTTNHYATEAYDDAGNVTQSGGSTFSYDSLGRQTGATVGGRRFLYLYSADEERVGAIERVTGTAGVVRNRPTWTMRGLGGELRSVWRDTSAEGGGTASWAEDEIYRGSQLLANVTATYGTRHYTLDHLGSPRLVTDANGSKLGEQQFAPFGVGGTSDGGALQFTGYERDQATLGGGSASLPDYAHARFYDAAGRFLSVDPVLDIKAAMTSPQRWNRYAYVSNNPINKIDPNGRDELALMDQLQREQLAVAAGEMSSAEYTERNIGRGAGALLGALAAFGGKYLAPYAVTAFLTPTTNTAITTTVAGIAGVESGLLGGRPAVEVQGVRFTEFYLEKLATTGRGNAPEIANAILKAGSSEFKPLAVSVGRRPGETFNLYRATVNGKLWEMVYNPKTREVYHILRAKADEIITTWR